MCSRMSASNDARFPADIFELPLLALPAISRILLKIRVWVTGNLPIEMGIIPEEFPKILFNFLAQ